MWHRWSTFFGAFGVLRGVESSENKFCIGTCLVKPKCMNVVGSLVDLVGGPIQILMSK